MKKLLLVAATIAAVGTITPALAERISVGVGAGVHHRHVHERVVIREHHDRGLHRGWYQGHHYGWRHSHHHGARVVIR